MTFRVIDANEEAALCVCGHPKRDHERHMGCTRIVEDGEHCYCLSFNGQESPLAAAAPVADTPTRPPRPDLEKYIEAMEKEGKPDATEPLDKAFSNMALGYVELARYALYLEQSRAELEQKAKRWDAIEPDLYVSGLRKRGHVQLCVRSPILDGDHTTMSVAEFVDALARGGK